MTPKNLSGDLNTSSGIWGGGGRGVGDYAASPFD